MKRLRGSMEWIALATVIAVLGLPGCSGGDDDDSEGDGYAGPPAGEWYREGCAWKVDAETLGEPTFEIGACMPPLHDDSRYDVLAWTALAKYVGSYRDGLGQVHTIACDPGGSWTMPDLDDPACDEEVRFEGTLKHALFSGEAILSISAIAASEDEVGCSTFMFIGAEPGYFGTGSEITGNPGFLVLRGMQIPELWGKESGPDTGGE